MFKNIGDKIKTLTLIISITGMVLSVVAGGVFIMLNVFDEFVYNLVCGIIIMVIGSLYCWIGGFAMYGFGELIDRTSSIDKKLNFLIRQNNERYKK